jgi:hypothetical protein
MAGRSTRRSIQTRLCCQGRAGTQTSHIASGRSQSLLSSTTEGAKVVVEIPGMPEAALRTMVAPVCLAQSIAFGLTLTGD